MLMVDEAPREHDDQDTAPQEEQPSYVGDSVGGAGSSPTHSEEERGASMFSGTLIGMIFAVLIGWIPVVGAFATGLVAGWFSRSRLRGMYAAFLPGIVCLMWFFVLGYAYDIPFLQTLAETIAPMEIVFQGTSSLVYAVIFTAQFPICFLGGWIGGDIRERREGRAGDEWPRPV